MFDQPIDEISTRWSEIRAPAKFVNRYSVAIRSYIQAIVGDGHDVDEVLQEFMLMFVRTNFPAKLKGGRFRNFLKVSVRNVAMSHLRKKKKTLSLNPSHSKLLRTEQTPESLADQIWTDSWRNCLLQSAWRWLEIRESQQDENHFYSVLRSTIDHPDLSSAQHASRLSNQFNREISPAAFRKQLSRARKAFAEKIVSEVRKTVENGDSETVELELQDLGLKPFIEAR